MGRKAKFVQVTPENIKQIYGRLRNFFAHKPIYEWHDYDCGNTKRVSVNGRLKSKTGKVCLDAEGYIFGLAHGHKILCIGNWIAFCGNRIIIKKKKKFNKKHNYVYVCYQIEKPAQKNKPCDWDYIDLEIAPGITRRYVNPAILWQVNRQWEGLKYDYR